MSDIAEIRPGGRRTDQNVFLSGILEQENFECREQNHEECCILSSADLLKLIGQVRGNVRGHSLAIKGLKRGPYVIGRKVQQRKFAGQLLPPVL